MKTNRIQFFLVFISPLISGCSFPYYWQAVDGHLELMRNQVSVEKIIDNAKTSKVTRDAIKQIIEAKIFASERLSLKDNGSYRTYVDLERTFVVWNVVAAEEFSVDPETWCFLFVGCVSYRGYFNESSAIRFSKSLSEGGMDTTVVGAIAYSTLGMFDDPILNTMVDFGEQRGVSIVFHELAHQKFYIKGDSELNEAFATAIEEYGTALWLASVGDDEEITRYSEQIKRSTDFSKLVLSQRARLSEIYSRNISDEERRKSKEAAFDLMRQEYEELKQTWEGVTDYDNWFDRDLNNAHLATVATYRQWLPGLKWVLDTQGLESFYNEIEALASLSFEGRRSKMHIWTENATK
ncbi:MAG: aminopeptidase [Rhodospirillaceae bacterium]|nr:aminopeptidase [Rhodospirillaceae bacterium]